MLTTALFELGQQFYHATEIGNEARVSRHLLRKQPKHVRKSETGQKKTNY